MKIAGVVVWYNPDKESISNIKTYNHNIDKLYIIDNSEHLMGNPFDNDKDIEYISFGKNMGLAFALNAAVRKAMSENYDWLLTMDQDSKFSNNIIEIYKNYIVNNDCKRVAILSPQYNTERNHPVKNNDIVELYWTMQSADLFNLNVMRELGLFEEKYFIDCIDYEYCLRARKYGYKILRCNEAVLNHSPAINKRIGLFNYGYASPIRIYYQTRNAYDMWLKYESIKALGIILIKFIKSILLYDNKIIYIKMIKEGLCDGANGKFGKKEVSE